MSKKNEPGASLGSFDEIPLEAYAEYESASPHPLEDLPFPLEEVPLVGIEVEMPPGVETVEAPAEAPKARRVSTPPAVREGVEATPEPSFDELVFDVLAAFDGMSSVDVLPMLDQLRTVLNDLAEDGRHPMMEVVEVLTYLANSDPAAPFIYESFNVSLFSSQVRSVIRQLASAPTPSRTAAACLADLELTVNRQKLLEPALDLVSALKRRAPMEQVGRLLSRLRVRGLDGGEDPVDRVLRSAAEWDSEAKKRQAGVDRIRLSSGWPHLDLSQTPPGGVPGFMSPGHLAGFVAPSGHGKSSFVRELLRNFALDLRNWGMPHAKVLVVIVEEEPEQVVRSARLDNEYAEVAEQVLIAKVNSSRQRFAQAFFEAVRDAAVEADAAGQPVREFMPWVVILDYLQEIQEEGENAWTDAIERTTSLLRAIAACDPEEVEKFSGVKWTEVSGGMPWPEGLEDHRIGIVVTAQVKGLDESTLYWKEGGRLSIDDFVLRDANGNPLWKVLPGDHRIVRRGDVAGAKKFLNNLSVLVFLHRSNPRAAIEQYDRVLLDGTTMKAYRSTDTRARFIFEKMRYGASEPVIPMAFSSQPDGRAARWIDYRAEHQVRQEISTGQRVKRDWWWQWDPNWYSPVMGGPILPKRPRRSPASRVTY